MVVAIALVLADCSANSESGSPTNREARARAIPFTEATVSQSGNGYAIGWSADADDVETVTVYAGDDHDDVGRDNEVGSGAATDEIEVSSLPEAGRWYFELVPDEGAPLVVANRSLHLASAPNLRAVGGYRTTDGQWVKVGLLYRSDGLDELTDADLSALTDLG